MAKTKEFDIVEWIELSYSTKVWKYLLFEVRTSSTSSVIRTDFMGYSGFWLEMFLASYWFQISRDLPSFSYQKEFSKAAHFHKRQIPHPIFLIDLQVSTTCIRCILKRELVKEEVSWYSMNKCLCKIIFGIIWGVFTHFYEHRQGMGIITQNSSIWSYTITLRVLRKNHFLHDLTHLQVITVKVTCN